MKRDIFGAILRVLLCLAAMPAWAVTGDDVAPGTACSVNKAMMMTANPSGTGGYILTCEGGIWVATLRAAPPSEDGQVATKKYVDDTVSAGGSGGSPAGALMAFAMSTPPTGWLKADGSAVSRTTYPSLFAAIGTTYGAGDGSTTFNLPDLRGEFIRGWDNGRGVDSGRIFGSSQADELRSHTHITQAQNFNQGYFGGGSSITLPQSPGFGPPTLPTGGTETRPRNVAIMYCIKY